MSTVQQRAPRSSVDTITAARNSGGEVFRTLTAAQERAIRTAMQIFVEEDLAFGARRAALRWCVRCAAERPGAGSIDYECGSLCNPCATAYELARAQGLVRTPAQFLDH